MKFRFGVVGLVCVALSAGDSALAFPDAQTPCEQDDHYVNYFIDGEWNTSDEINTYLPDVEAGFTAWNGPKARTGSQLVTVNRTYDDDYADVIVTIGVLDNGEAETICGAPALMTFDPDTLDADRTTRKYVARHEMGHVTGLHHSGQADGKPENYGPVTTMSTCHVFQSENAFASDDVANLTRYHDDHPQSGYAYYGANFGFEGGMDGAAPNWWQVPSGGTVLLDTTDAHSGNKKIRWQRSAPGDTLEQAMNVARGNDTSYKYRPRAVYKAASSAYSGQVQLRLWKRTINYKTEEKPDCDTGPVVDGLDYLNVLEYGAPSAVLDTGLVTFNSAPTTWVDLYPVNSGVSEWFLPTSAPDGLELRVVINGKVLDGTTEKYLHLDNVRIERST